MASYSLIQNFMNLQTTTSQRPSEPLTSYQWAHLWSTVSQNAVGRTLQSSRKSPSSGFLFYFQDKLKIKYSHLRTPKRCQNPNNQQSKGTFMQQNLSVFCLWGSDKFTGFWQAVSPFDKRSMQKFEKHCSMVQS